MKVDVITVSDVAFRPWRWWSNWVDIAVFDFDYCPWLIQMRVGRNNVKRFRSVRLTGFWYRQATIREVGSLVQMKKEQANV